MKLNYDPKSGVLHVRVANGTIEQSVQHSDGVYLEVDESGRVLAAEFLSLAELAEAITEDGGEWELPERIEDPDAYEEARGEHLTPMRRVTRRHLA